MEPVSLALAFLLKHPSVAKDAMEKATAPAVVDVSKMQGSFADMSRGVLQCYHKTARFVNADLVGSPWNRQAQYAAQNSMVVRIRYTGVSTAHYEMVVAVMAKDDKVRTAVLGDTATVPYNKKCQLEDWTGA
jgi:hypothetical protein